MSIDEVCSVRRLLVASALHSGPALVQDPVKDVAIVVGGVRVLVPVEDRRN